MIGGRPGGNSAICHYHSSNNAQQAQEVYYMFQQKTKNTIAHIVFATFLTTWAGVSKAQEPIIHDAEFRILEAQNGERWKAENKVIEAKLAEIRKQNGNKPPNIVYILLDDVGFGEIGMPDVLPMILS